MSRPRDLGELKAHWGLSIDPEEMSILFDGFEYDPRLPVSLGSLPERNIHIPPTERSAGSPEAVGPNIPPVNPRNTEPDKTPREANGRTDREELLESVTLVPLLQSRSSEADAFQKLLTKHLIAQVGDTSPVDADDCEKYLIVLKHSGGQQVLVVQTRVLLYTTRNQGERSVYSVELNAGMAQGAYFSTMVTPSHEFRNPVVKVGLQSTFQTTA